MLKLRTGSNTGSDTLVSVCDPTRPDPDKIADTVTRDPETRFHLCNTLYLHAPKVVHGLGQPAGWVGFGRVGLDRNLVGLGRVVGHSQLAGCINKAFYLLSISSVKYSLSYLLSTQVIKYSVSAAIIMNWILGWFGSLEQICLLRWVGLGQSVSWVALGQRKWTHGQLCVRLKVEF